MYSAICGAFERRVNRKMNRDTTKSLKKMKEERDSDELENSTDKSQFEAWTRINMQNEDQGWPKVT